MIKVTTNEGTTISVRWNYLKDRGITICKIDDDTIQGEIKPLTVAVAKKSKNDKFCKETARKLTLTRALKVFDKNIRRLIWKAYFQRSPKMRANPATGTTVAAQTS